MTSLDQRSFGHLRGGRHAPPDAPPGPCTIVRCLRPLGGALAGAMLTPAFGALAPGAAAAVECAPHCDYNHYYGPYDFSYIRPGLYAYPVCNRRGTCSPYLAYGVSGLHYGNIIVEFPRRRRPPPR